MTTLADSGAGSLRHLIAAANSAAGADTIDFDAKLSGTIVLSSPITITDELAIIGSGTTAVSGNNATGIFVLTMGTAAAPVTISDLNFLDGASSTEGGAIDNDNAALTLTDCVFTGNTAGNGGAIALNTSDASLAASGCTFEDNTSNFLGGAIYSYQGAATLDACVFDDNASPYGGAIALFTGDASLTAYATTFNTNTAEEDGGAAYILDGTASFDSCTFNGNIADTGYGGAVEFNGDELEVFNCTFTGNAAGLSGGAASVRSGVDATTTLTELSDNTAGEHGGGIYAVDNFGGEVVIDFNGLLSNTAGLNGGGIYLTRNESAAVTATVLDDNNSGGSGGGLWLAGKNLSGGEFTLADCTFANNSAVEDGGGAYLASFPTPLDAVVQSVTFDTNTAVNGGGLYVGAGINLTATNANNLKIKNNIASGSGGGAYLASDTFGLTNAVVTGNEAAEEGGGLAVRATIDIIDTSIEGNSAVRGGGLHVAGYANPTVMNSTIAENTAQLGGGAYYKVENTNVVEIINSTISANVADNDDPDAEVYGGGLYFDGTFFDPNPIFYGNYAIFNSTIVDNIADPGDDNTASAGGGIYATQLATSIPLYLNSTIVARNVAGGTVTPGSGDGADVFVNFPTLVLAESNFLGVGDDGFTLDPGSNSKLGGKSSAPGDPGIQPLGFYGGPTKTHALEDDSDAIDEGLNTKNLDYDQRGPGFPREVREPDIGAYELQDTPRVTYVKLNDGIGDQRSMVTSMTVYFDRLVTFTSTTIEDSFELLHLGNSTSVTLTTTDTAPLNEVTFTFSGSNTTSTSLNDGNYGLTVFAATTVDASNGTKLDGNGDGTPGDDYETKSGNLYRYFGDSDGDRDVDFIDFLAFRASFGKSSGQAGYNFIFDYNNDGSVNFTDFLQFRTRFGTTLAP